MTNEEIAYKNGMRAAYTEMLRSVAGKIGSSPSLEAWKNERVELIASLRNLCKQLLVEGLNDWDDDDYLPGVVDNKITRLIESAGLTIKNPSS